VTVGWAAGAGGVTVVGAVVVTAAERPDGTPGVAAPVAPAGTARTDAQATAPSTALNRPGARVDRGRVVTAGVYSAAS
jgi:hypothetical protein